MQNSKLISFIDQRIEYWSIDDDENLNSDVIEELEQIKQYILIHG
ncbi:MAG: hypothetical protein WC917_03045 [Bacilli bacterium]|jgi:hypothetical protein